MKTINLHELSPLEETLKTYLQEKGPSFFSLLTNLRTSPPPRSLPDYSSVDLLRDDTISNYQQNCLIHQENGISITPSAYSYRRFLLSTPKKQYLLKTNSPFHSPEFGCIFDSSPQIEIPIYSFERPQLRSLVLQQYLITQGLPFSTSPIGNITIFSEDPLVGYNGLLTIDPYLPLDISIEEIHQQTTRIDMITPKLISQASQSQKISPFEYMEHLIKTLGKIHHQFHNLSDGCFLLTTTSAHGLHTKHYFNLTAPDACFLGENPLHNTEIDSSTGNIYLTADFSRALLLKEEPSFTLNPCFDPFLFTKTIPLSPEKKDLLQAFSLSFCMDTLQYNRPILYCLKKCGNITSQEYQDHISRVDLVLDNCQKIKSLFSSQQKEKFDFLSKKIIQYSSPWCQYTYHPINDIISIPIISSINEEIILNYTLLFSETYHLDQKLILKTIKQRIKKSIEKTKELSDLIITNLPLILAEKNQEENLYAQYYESLSHLLDSPVNKKMFTHLMDGYNSHIKN